MKDHHTIEGWRPTKPGSRPSNDVLIVGPTKTARSRRRITLDPETIDVLRRHRKAQAAERLAIGGGWVDGDLVFCRQDGEPVHPDWFTRCFAGSKRSST